MARLVSGWSPTARASRAPGVVVGKVAKARQYEGRQYTPPICFYGSATVSPGGEAEVSSGAISNTTGRPVELREIRLSADAPDTSTIYSNLAGVLRVTMAIGGKPLMADPVPLWLLGRTDNAVAQNFVVDSNESAAQYVWRLNKPLVLPPKCSVTAKFSHPGTINFDVTGRISLLGKFTDGNRGPTAVPYVLAWRSKESGIAAGSDESPERALMNTLGRALHVDRIIGRHVALSSGTFASIAAGTLTFADRGTIATSGQYGAVAPVLGLARLQLLTSRNWPIIKNFTPIWDVFGMSGSIEMPHVLPAGDFYLARVNYYATEPDLGLAPVWPDGTPTTFQHAVHLSFIGSREEVLA